MNRLVGMVTGNPMVLVWLAVAAFALGALTAGGAAWRVQGWRLDAVQSKFDGFVSTVKAEGEAADKLAKATAAANKKAKESSDHEYEANITALVADNQRLRNARASRGYLPAAASGSRSPETVTFDRAKLQQTLRHLDDGVSGLIDSCDKDAIALKVARVWAENTRGDMSRDSPASGGEKP